MAGDPLMTNGAGVPWVVYLSDQDRLHARLDRMEDKLDRALDVAHQLQVEAAADDGAEIAQDAAERALEERRKSRGERLWDIGRTVLAAVLGVAGALATAHLLG